MTFCEAFAGLITTNSYSLNVTKEKRMSVDKELLTAILSIKHFEDLDSLFQDLFTPGELADLSLRWKLLKDLDQGVTQRKIAEKYGISLCKITRGSKILKNKNSMVHQLLKEVKKNG